MTIAEDLEKSMLEHLMPTTQEETPLKRNVPFQCEESVDIAAKMTCYLLKYGTDCIDMENVVCDNANNKAVVSGFRDDGSHKIFLEIRPTYFNYYEDEMLEKNKKLDGQPYQLPKEKKPKGGAEIKTLGTLFEEPESKKGKETKDRLTVPLKVISAAKGKIGKNGVCRATKSRTVKKDCVTISAKSTSGMKYKFAVKTMPQNLMRKGAEIKVRLSDCDTMMTQSKCKTSSLQ